MAYSTIKLAYDGRVATITFNRPDKRNALSVQMIEETIAALAEVEKSEAVVLILTGAGKAFCAGMDLEELKSLTSKTPSENVADSDRMARFFRAIYEFPKPTIAAVNGAAMAGARESRPCAILRSRYRKRSLDTPKCGSDLCRPLCRQSWCGK